MSSRLIGSSSELDTGFDIRTAFGVPWVPLVSVGGPSFWVVVLGQVVLALGSALGSVPGAVPGVVLGLALGSAPRAPGLAVTLQLVSLRVLM